VNWNNLARDTASSGAHIFNTVPGILAGPSIYTIQWLQLFLNFRWWESNWLKTDIFDSGDLRRRSRWIIRSVLPAEDSCECFSLIFCTDVLVFPIIKDGDICGASSSNELLNCSPPFTPEWGRTAGLRLDPFIVELLSSVYYLLLILFCTQVVLLLLHWI